MKLTSYKSLSSNFLMRNLCTCDTVVLPGTHRNFFFKGWNGEKKEKIIIKQSKTGETNQTWLAGLLSALIDYHI